eukprot:scaffold2752_cov393-Prasinococcus_capsulatus_cf.AAC.28
MGAPRALSCTLYVIESQACVSKRTSASADPPMKPLGQTQRQALLIVHAPALPFILCGSLREHGRPARRLDDPTAGAAEGPYRRACTPPQQSCCTPAALQAATPTQFSPLRGRGRSPSGYSCGCPAPLRTRRGRARIIIIITIMIISIVMIVRQWRPRRDAPPELRGAQARNDGRSISAYRPTSDVRRAAFRCAARGHVGAAHAAAARPTPCDRSGALGGAMPGKKRDWLADGAHRVTARTRAVACASLEGLEDSAGCICAAAAHYLARI